MFFHLSITQASLCPTTEHHNGSPKSRGSLLSVLSSHSLLTDVDLKFGQNCSWAYMASGIRDNWFHSLFNVLFVVCCGLLTDVTQYGNILIIYIQCLLINPASFGFIRCLIQETVRKVQKFFFFFAILYVCMHFNQMLLLFI